MNFYIGQTFEGMYPPEAAAWCNSNNAHIEDTNQDTIAFVEEEYTVVEYVVQEYIVEVPRMTDGGKIVMVPVTKTRTVPVEKTEKRTVEKTVRVYKIVENLPPPETKTVRTFSKFSIWVATRSLPIAEGSSVMVWDAFEKFLNDAGLWTGWNQLVDLVEDNPFFEEFYPQAVEAFGKELVDNVLAASVTSTKTVVVEPVEE